MAADRQRERVLTYLYGEMDPAEVEAFRAELAADPSLAQRLAEEERFQRCFPVGQGTVVSDELLAESRLRLRAALRQEEQVSSSWIAWLATPLRRSARLGVRVGPAVVLLLVGLLLGRISLFRGCPWEEGRLPFLEQGRIVDLRLREFDPAAGRVKLAVSLLASAEVEGNLQEQRIQQLLATALQEDLESEARLTAVELLGYQTAGAEIRQALIHALRRDRNPGVRLQAVAALKPWASDEQVRQALLQALREDENPGVRVAALEVLRDFRDRATIQVLRRTAQSDANEYIRGEARDLLRQSSGISPL